jgi:hypothetical protein
MLVNTKRESCFEFSFFSLSDSGPKTVSKIIKSVIITSPERNNSNGENRVADSGRDLHS